MSKRFTDTNLWEEDWFIELPMNQKMFWFYLKDNCDHAAIWKPKKTMFERLNETTINLDEFLKNINKDKERIIVLENGRWFIVDFIVFQYGKVLNENNKVHKSIINLLALNGVKMESIRGLIDHKKGVKDKDKDKEKDIDIDIDKKKESSSNKYSKEVIEITDYYENLYKTNAYEMYEAIISKNLEETKESWHDTFDKLIRLDNEDVITIKAIIYALFLGEFKEFWIDGKNFRTATKFRKLIKDKTMTYYQFLKLKLNDNGSNKSRAPDERINLLNNHWEKKHPFGSNGKIIIDSEMMGRNWKVKLPEIERVFSLPQGSNQALEKAKLAMNNYFVSVNPFYRKPKYPANLFFQYFNEFLMEEQCDFHH